MSFHLSCRWSNDQTVIRNIMNYYGVGPNLTIVSYSNFSNNLSAWIYYYIVPNHGNILQFSIVIPNCHLMKNCTVLTDLCIG